MESTYDIKKIGTRKIPKMRVGRKHHYVMIYPREFKNGGKELTGMPYINFRDSWIEDCHKRTYKHFPEIYDYELEVDFFTACLN